MQSLLLILALLQPGPRPPLAPAETLIEPDQLRSIERAPVEGPAVPFIAGTEKAAGEIVLACAPSQCEAVWWALKKISHAIAAKAAAPPSRTIRVVGATDERPPAGTRAAIMVVASKELHWEIVRGAWSTAGIGDEGVELFARHAVGSVNARPFADTTQPSWDWLGVPTTTIVMPANASGPDRASFIAAASAYFLATLPNAGAESLLSHLTVGAHARLAEDGRRAVAMMGNQQRAGADVLIFFGQAIEREQRRMRSFERFMPEPVDPMLRSRIADMEKGITAIWTSIGITNSPFVPAAERLRGRGGEDRRVPSRAATDRLPAIEPATAMLMYANLADILYELGNLIDGTRSISDVRDILSAEFGPIPLPLVVDYFERLAKAGAVTLR